METRDFYEKEIANILENYQNSDLSVADAYRVNIIEMLNDIDNEDYLRKIYSFVSVFRD